MSKYPEVGCRVVALLDAKNGIVRSFGAGKYVGDFVPPREIGGFNMGRPNPKLDLDNGKTAWGCECWWETEDAIKMHFPEDKWKWENVDIDEYRKEMSES